MDDRALSDVDALVADLRHRSPERRTSAAMRLLSIGRGAVKPLARSLELVDHGHDRAAVAVLKQLGGVAATGLAELLIQGARHQRRQAARALRELGADALPALGAVLDALADPDQDRGVALRLLGVVRQLGPDAAPRSVPVLVELLSNEIWSIWAADLLGLLGYHAINAEPALLDLAALGEDAERDAARRALARIAPRALSGLRRGEDQARDADGLAGSSSGHGPLWERIRFAGGSLAFSLPEHDPACDHPEVECVLSDRSGRVIAMGRMVADASLQFGAVREIGADFRAVPLDVDRMVVVMVRARLGLGRPDETSLSWISELPIFRD